MKKAMTVALTIVLFLLGVSASAEGDRKSGLFTYRLKGNGTAVITGFDWATNGKNDIYVPRMIDGYTVTEIGEKAFSIIDEDEIYTLSKSDSGIYIIDRSGIGYSVAVVLPDTITIIGEKAFLGTDISSSIIPASVQLIGPGAFAGCVNIKSHSVASGNPVYAVIDGVLYNKQSKELVSMPANHTSDFIIPEGIVSIGDYAFWGMYYQISLDLSFPSTLKRIGNFAFSYSYLLRQDIEGKNRPYFDFNNIQEIGNYAFSFARISDIYVNYTPKYIKWDNLNRIGAFAFYQALIPATGKDFYGQAEFAFPETLREMGEGAFYELRSKIFQLDFSKSKLIVIPEYAFYCCDLQGKILFPEELKKIGKYAFAGCKSQPIFSSTIEIIDDYAFSTIELESQYSFISKATSVGQTSLYNAFSESSKISSIGDYAFYGAVGSYIGLPDGLESIGTNAFFSGDLDTLSIPSSVKQIGDNVCDRTKTNLEVEAGSYAALYASENGYPILNAGGEDTSWLNN